MYWTPSAEAAEPRTTHRGVGTVEHVLANGRVAGAIAAVETAIEALESVVRESPAEEQRSAPCDETLNWCFAEANDHLRSAVWSLAAGFYPTALVSTGTALQLGLAALDFAIAARDAAGIGAAGALGAWEAGAHPPAVNVVAARLGDESAIRDLLDKVGVDVAGRAREVDAALRDGMRLRHLPNGYGPPCFHPDGFASTAEALHEVIGVLGACWITVFPALLAAARSDADGQVHLDAVFAHPWPRRVLEVALTAP